MRMLRHRDRYDNISLHAYERERERDLNEGHEHEATCPLEFTLIYIEKKCATGHVNGMHAIVI